ncbi:MAG TPA: hypothetical protein VGI03_11565 [Verrucomicrobiae bacterium]|jgi:hypothetical protein
MALTEFTDQQKQSLVDLMVLGMYADGNLDLIEDEKARRVLDSISFSSDSARQYFLDASFARARKNNISLEATRKYIGEIVKNFPTPAMRRQTYEALEDSLSSDRKIADGETKLLVAVYEGFGL